MWIKLVLRYLKMDTSWVHWMLTPAPMKGHWRRPFGAVRFRRVVRLRVARESTNDATCVGKVFKTAQKQNKHNMNHMNQYDNMTYDMLTFFESRSAFCFHYQQFVSASNCSGTSGPRTCPQIAHGWRPAGTFFSAVLHIVSISMDIQYIFCFLN